MAEAYQHLTCKQRYQLSVLLESNTYYSQSKMAKEIGVKQPTISRELANNSGENGYCPEEAHAKATARRSEANSRRIKLTQDMKAYIDYYLTKLQWSPEQISGRMKKEKEEGKREDSISHERIYQYIWEDKRNGGTLYKHLSRSGKKYKKRGQKTAGRGVIPNRIGIEERPEIVEAKTRVGDFEVDTIVGANHQGAILSVVDRKTKLTILKLLHRGTALNVEKAMVVGLQHFKENVHTITSDNGKEFSRHQEIAQQLNAGFYFANPYHAWERGLNENTNGLVRRYFPKGTDFRTLTQEDVDRVQHLLNTRPRKSLNFRTPLEAFFEETSKMIAQCTPGSNFIVVPNSESRLLHSRSLHQL